MPCLRQFAIFVTSYVDYILFFTLKETLVQLSYVLSQLRFISCIGHPRLRTSRSRSDARSVVRSTSPTFAEGPMMYVIASSNIRSVSSHKIWLPNKPNLLALAISERPSVFALSVRNGPRVAGHGRLRTDLQARPQRRWPRLSADGPASAAPVPLARAVSGRARG